jgi:hypothetical protein
MGWPGQAAEHEPDHGEPDEGGDGAGVALEIARQAAVAADPGERALDDPTLGEDDEAMQLAALDDLQRPRAGLGYGRGERRALIARVGEDALDEGKETARADIEDTPCSIAVLHCGRVNDNVQEEAERIDEDVPLAARDLLARIVALRVERGAPF